MAAPQLFYFEDNKGRAELIRLLYVITETEFLDNRVPSEEYKRMRLSGELPLNQFPVLKVDGQTLAQTCAIARYAARQVGIYPTDPLEAAISDMVVDTWKDCFDLYIECAFDRTVVGGHHIMVQRDMPEIIQRLKTFFEFILPPQLAGLERVLSSSKLHYASGHAICWSDVAIFDLISTFSSDAKSWAAVFDGFKPPAVVDNYPTLRAIQQTVLKHPKVASWVEKYPY